ncbi:MAG: isoprenylcysteine carboxylmethyltransferase family protein [Oligoflexus sp.]
MMQQQYLAIWLGFGCAFMAMAEIRLHRTNIPFLNYVGGQEIRRTIFRTYYLSNYFIMTASLVFLFFQPSLPQQGEFLVPLGLLLVALGASLKFWSMHSLGRLWSFRCIYIPDMPVVKAGPYRLLRHPEYVARFFEVFGLMISSGAVDYLWPLLLVQIWLVRLMCRFEMNQIRGLNGFSGHLAEEGAMKASLRVDY